MEQISYKVGDLKRIIRESAQEFNPKVGPGVMADNKSNNDKSYKDAEKAAKDYDGGLQPEKKGKLPDKTDGNRTTLDYNPRTNPGKDFKDKVDAQAKGYTSKLEEENGIAKAAEFDNDGQIKKQFEKSSDDINKQKHDLAKSGLQGHNLDIKEKETMYENKKPQAKRLSFRHTKFLNEAQMLSRIPEEYKVDGQKIYMKDAANNEYIVECVKSEKSGFIETNIVGYSNDKLMNEQVNRIQELFDYKTNKDYAPTTVKERIDENDSFQGMMDLARDIIK